MAYEFIRRLTKGLPEELTGIAATALTDHGIELYVSAQDTGTSDEERDRTDPVRYAAADASTHFPNGNIYVPAADRERAIMLLEQAGAADYICEDPVESLEMTESEKLEADMLRRHRRNTLICLVIILLAVIYYVLS